MTTVHDDLVVARVAPPAANYTYSYTLASRLGEMLRLVEDRFGHRDSSFTILGIEFCDTGPNTWFPGNCGHLVVQLSLSTMMAPMQAVFQLAHESVHLLDPGVFGTTSVFEEGTANLFAKEYACRVYPSYSTSDVKYDAASALARQVTVQYPDAVRQLRAQGIRFSSITASQLQAICPMVRPALAEVLCSNFHDWQGLIWVFGYGSLMWDGWEEEFKCLARAKAVLPGYKRAFNKASVRNWGTKEMPGPTLNLIDAPNGKCEGVAFAFPAASRDAVVSALKTREGKGFALSEPPVILDEVGSVPAIMALYNGGNVIRNERLEEIAAMARNAVGGSGRCVDYVRGVTEKLAELNIDDAAVRELWDAVRQTGAS